MLGHAKKMQSTQMIVSQGSCKRGRMENWIGVALSKGGSVVTADAKRREL